MTHVDEGTLLAHLDGQSGEDREEVAAHLAACPVCAAELRSLRDMTAELQGALLLTDRPAPIEAARARLRAARTVAPHVAPRRGIHVGPFRMGLLQAAMLALVLAGVVGAAIPGTPLRLWIESMIDAITADEPVPAVEPPVVTVPEPPAAEPAVVPSEYRVEAVNGRVDIALSDPPANARITVDLSDDERATLRAPASMSTSPGRLEAFAMGEGEIDVTLPRDGVTSTVSVDGRTVVRREAGEYTYLAPGASVEGDVVVLRISR